MPEARSEAASEPCVFCAIVRRESPAWIVFEDTASVAFLDLFPYTRGHLLVVPKRHVDRLVELRSGEHGEYLRSVAEACRRVERLAHDYNVAMNQGRLAGQIIFHLHFHIIPRYNEGNPFQVHGRERIAEPDARELLTVLGPS
ncbi:MAG TPA: HIT family protein [Thermoplasmata archaeon]|nr:HIT family protein [Thermoplasmata archaeon]